MQDTFDTTNETYAMKRKALGGAINQLFNTAKTDSKIVVPLVNLVAPLGLDLSVYEDEDLTKTLYENIAKNKSLKNLNKVMKDLPLINVVKIGNILSERLVGKRDATKALADRTIAVNYFVAAVTELNEYFASIDTDYVLPLPDLTKQYKRPVGVDEAIRVKPKRKKKSLLGEAVPNDTVTLETTVDPVVEANPEVIIPKLKSPGRGITNYFDVMECSDPIVIQLEAPVREIKVECVFSDTKEVNAVEEIGVEEVEVTEVTLPSDRIIILNSFLMGKKETGEPARTMSSLAKKCESDEEFFNKISTSSYRKHITKKFFNQHKELFLSYNPDAEETIFAKAKKDETGHIEVKELIHPNQGSFEFEPDEKTKEALDCLKTIDTVCEPTNTANTINLEPVVPATKPVKLHEKVKAVFSKIFRLK